MDSEFTTLEITALAIAFIGCFSLPTLLGLWLSKFRLLWMLQGLLIFVIVSPLMLIHALDLMLIVLVNAFLVLIGWKSWHWWQQRKVERHDNSAQKPWFQMRLQDSLAAFVLLAVVAAVLAQTRDIHIWIDDSNAIAWGALQCLGIGAAAAI